MNRFLASSLVLVSMALGGCAGGGDPTTATEEDLTAKNTGLFVAVSNEPSGGDFANITKVKRANSAKTKCADGKGHVSCTVIGLDFSALGLTSAKEAKLDAAFRAGHAILQGKVQNSKVNPATHASVPEIVVTAAWMGAGGNNLAGDDRIYTVSHVVQNFMCLNGPCATINQDLDNTKTTKRINSVNLDGVGASKTELKDADDAMLIGGGGLLVGGFDSSVVTSKVNIGTFTVTTLNATDFYLPYE